MTTRHDKWAILPIAIACFAMVSSNQGIALTAKECSAKFKAAKAAGTLNGMGWSDFRKTQCAGVTETANPKPTAAPTPTKTAAVFPKAVDPKYAKETPGKARFHTCLDQYHANKASNGNGGLKWIAKGGGYYSACNKALKG